MISICIRNGQDLKGEILIYALKGFNTRHKWLGFKQVIYNDAHYSLFYFNQSKPISFFRTPKFNPINTKTGPKSEPLFLTITTCNLQSSQKPPQSQPSEIITTTIAHSINKSPPSILRESRESFPHLLFSPSDSETLKTRSRQNHLKHKIASEQFIFQAFLAMVRIFTSLTHSLTFFFFSIFAFTFRFEIVALGFHFRTHLRVVLNLCMKY